MTDPETAGRLRRLLWVTDVALAHLSPEDLLDELLIRVREILEADTAAVLLLDESTGELVARAAKGLEEEVERGVRIPVGQGFAGRIAAQRTPVVIRRVDHRNVRNPILREKGVRSLLGVPLLVRGKVLGVLHVGTLVERRFTAHDVELLQLVAERAALAFHVRLYERERMTETLQRTYLPDALPDVPGLRLASRYLPASSAAGIGGDWYDVYVLPSGAVALAMGDVAGHGLSAASVMGKIRNALRAYSVDVADPVEVVARLDRLMKYFEVDDIVTCSSASWTPTSPRSGSSPRVISRRSSSRATGGASPATADPPRPSAPDAVRCFGKRSSRSSRAPRSCSTRTGSSSAGTSP